MIIEACECGGLPPHDHPARQTVVDSRLIMVPQPDEFHIWVDWREVARQLMLEARHG